MKARTNGFTLIEVMIALIILAAGLTAVISTSMESAKNVAAVEDKVVAQWVAQNVITQVRMGIIPLAQNSDQGISGQTNMLKKQWRWSVRAATNPNTNVARLTVVVGNSDEANVYSMTGFKLESQ
jgi:general secretion pathway protein I